MFLTRFNRPSLLRALQRPVQVSQFSDDGNYSSDDEKKKTKKAKSQTTPKQDLSAADRLNNLLASMNTQATTLSQAVKIPQAGARKQKLAQKKAEQAAAKDQKKPENIVQAAKEVADLMGDKTKQTEAELLSKLLNHVDGGSSHAAKSDAGGQSLSDLIVSMKIDRTKKQQPTPSRGDIVRKAIASRRTQQRPEFEQQEQQDRRFRPRQPRRTEPVPSSGSVDLFGDRLGIFTNPDELQDSPDILETWSHLQKRELKLAIAHPPKNYFEKMIQWTEQGKVWKFPIDNEQGLDEEAKVDFTEHVFLEQHLEGWCPTRGPIRHFMELVCVGLSKNPYITAQAKKEHILWYRDYFEGKKDLLKQVIIDQKETGKGDAKTKSLEQ